MMALERWLDYVTDTVMLWPTNAARGQMWPVRVLAMFVAIPWFYVVGLVVMVPIALMVCVCQTWREMR